MASSAPARPKAKPPPALPAKLPPCGFLVTATKKGSLPVSVEKRPKGKKVTIISNIQGSATSLLSSLSSLLGCGGTKRQEASGIHWTVEIQGDQTERVLAALTQLGCLKGVKKENDEKQDKKQVEVATRQCAYDKFLRRGDEDGKGELLAEFRLGTLLPGAECSKWHGPWLYCRGNCERTDAGDVWEEGLGGEDGGRPAAAAPPPSSTAELNLALRSLGMLAEVGFAVRSGAQQRNPAAAGLSLAEYKRQAVGPGARLVDDEPEPGAVRGAAARRRAASRAKSRSRGGGATVGPAMVRSRSCGPALRADGRASAPAPARRPAPPAQVPAPKQGVYRCLICGCTFGLQKTLKLHRRNAHPGMAHPAAEGPPPLAAEHRPAASRSAAHALTPARSAPWSPPHSPPPQASPPTPSAPSRASPAPRASVRPAAAAARKAKAWSECPLCYKRVPAGDAYEAHVQACCALADVQARAAYGDDAARGSSSEASGDDDPAAVPAAARAGPTGGVGAVAEGPEGEVDFLRLVCTSFTPDSSVEGTEVQIEVQEGEAVRVSWLQPREEGGYWAYVARTKVAQQGYVPASCLHGLRGDAAEPQVPESWIESFLQLDLPKEGADRFWRTYSDLQKRLGMMDAWLTAFSQACDSKDSGGILAEPTGGVSGDAPGGRAPEEPSSAGAARRGSRGGPEERPQASAGPPAREPSSPDAAAGSELRRWAAEEVERLAQQERAAARSARRAARRAEAAQPAAGDATPAPATAASAEPPREESGAAAAAAGAAVAEGEQPSGQEPVLMVATHDFAPENEGHSQVRLRAGDEVRVEWLQPEADGGYWAYGEVLGGEGLVGYFPAQCVRPEETAAARAVRAAGAAPPAAVAAAEAAAPAPLHHPADAAAAPAAAGNSSWRQRRAAAAGKSRQSPCASAAAGGGGGDAAAAGAGFGAAAGAGFGAAGGVAAGAAAGAGFGGAASAAAGGGGGGGDAAAGCSPRERAAEARRFALKKLEGMVQRYCRDRLDPEAVYSILIASTSAAEMREEAKNIIADNQVVDNFVAELWRKRSESTGHRPCQA